MTSPKQLNEEDHYYDRLANLQMEDYIASKKDLWISIVEWTENNETRLNALFPDNIQNVVQ